MRKLHSLPMLLLLCLFFNLNAQNKANYKNHQFEGFKSSSKNMEEENIHIRYAKQIQLDERVIPNNSVCASSYSDIGDATKWPENEVVEKRTRASKTFINADGSYSVYMIGDIHYMDESGYWKDIELNLENCQNGKYNKYTFVNQKNNHKTYISENPKAGFIIDGVDSHFELSKNQSVFVLDSSGTKRLELKSNQSSGRVVNNRVVNYPNLYNGIDMQNILLKHGVENAYIINTTADLPQDNQMFLLFYQEVTIPDGYFVYDSKGNLQTKAFLSNWFTIQNPNIDEVIRYSEIRVFDGKFSLDDIMKQIEYPQVLEIGDRNEKTTDKPDSDVYKTMYYLEFDGQKLKVTYKIPMSWLLSSDRTFPIYVDPVIELLTSYTQYSWAGNGDPYNTFYYDARYQSLLLSSDLTNVGIPSGSTFNAIDFNVYARPGRNVTNFRIRLQNTTNTTSTNWVTSGFNTNYGPANIARPTAGWKTYTFSSTHIWDGNNLLLDISRDNTAYTSGGGMYVRGTISNRACYGYSDSGYTWPFDGMTANSFNYLPSLRIDYTIPSCTTPNTYSVTGGGSYCSGGGGVAVGLSGSQAGVTYQLYRGATPVGGTVAGTGSALNFGNQTTAGTYTVQTTSAGGYCAISMTGSAVVTVLNAPSITGQPTNQTASPSTSAAFNVTSTGSGLSYQWQENTGSGWSNVTNGGVYSGATSASLVITNPAMTMNGYQYRCIVTNSCGTETSDGNATLTVDYCESYAFDWDVYFFDDDITRVVFNTIDNSTGSGNDGYYDYTAISTEVSPGSSYNLSIYVNTDGAYTYHQYAWIDWNSDGDFDDVGEGYDLGTAYNVSSGNSSYCPLSITIPISAVQGTTRMRISSRYNTDPSFCDTDFDGEVEDYSIIVSGCSTPNSVYASNITYNSATLNWTAPAIPPTNGYEYYYSTSSTPPAGSGTNNSDTNVDLSSLSPATTYYVWVRSDCGGGDFSSWTTMYQFTTNASPCTISSLNFTGSSRTPTLDGGYYYFDVCIDETLTLQANATCTDCGSATNYNWAINAYDGNGVIDFASNPLDYDIDYASGYDALLEIEGDACYISYPLRFRASDGPEIGNISATINGCSGDGTEITVGGSGSSVEVEAYHGEVTASLGVGAETFIPDGPSCTTQCYESSVTFTDFAPGTTITSANDIRYVKINMEHTFIGDMQITLEGPGGCGSAVILPDRYTIADGGLDDETYDWPWTFVGFYCGFWGDFEGYGKLVGGEWYTTMDFDEITVFETVADAHAAATTYPLNFSCSWADYDFFVAKTALGVPNTDDLTTSTDPCDGTEWYNDSGIGWDYCWSNNSSYSYSSSANSYIYEPENVDFYDPTEASYSFVRVNPSDETAGTNFYHPFEDFFTELVGCPLNGTWTIKVCDSWEADNGWIFDWELSLDPDLLPVNWDYDVNVNNVDWTAITDASFSGSFPTYDLIPNPGLGTGNYGGTFTVIDEYGCESDATLSFDVTGMSPIAGIAPGDYIWAGFIGEEWDDDLNNWFVFDGTNYNYASTYPDATKNVHIVDYCGNTDPMVVNSNAFCKDLNVAAGKTLGMSATTHYTLNITGDWNNDGTFNAGISTVNFTGTGTQDINTAVPSGEVFYNLSLNKTAGTELNAFKNITILNELDLSSGVLNTNSNTVFMTHTAPGALINGNNSGNDAYILGRLQRATDGSSTYTFPIGYSGYGAQGFDIGLTGNMGSNILGFIEPFSVSPLQSLSYCDVETHPGGGTHVIGEGLPGFDGIPDKILFDMFSPLQWDITNPGGGITSYDLIVYPSGAQLISPIVSANGEPLLYLMKNGEPGNTGMGVGDQLPWFTDIGFLVCPTRTFLNDLTSFSDFNLVGASGTGSILPVELVKFEANCNPEKINVIWQTASELNSHAFILENSYDMKNFYEVARISAAGNSNVNINYETQFEADLNRTIYLRLKQIDIDGTVRILETISLTCDELLNEKYLIVYPNPYTAEFFVVAENLADSDIRIEIIDELGKLVYYQNFRSFGGKIFTGIDGENLSSGLYYLRLITEKEILNEKIIKK